MSPPPPLRWLATQVQKTGGIAAVVLGGFCEHSDRVHRLVNMFAAGAGPGNQRSGDGGRAGLDSKPAAAYERHRIRLRMAAGAWRDYHGSIHAPLPFVHASSTDYAAIQIELQ
jgi:hypothetical protein